MGIQNAIVECNCGEKVHVPYAYESRCPKCMRRIRAGKVGYYAFSGNNPLDEGNPVVCRFAYHPTNSFYFGWDNPEIGQEVAVVMSKRNCFFTIWTEEAQKELDSAREEVNFPLFWVPLQSRTLSPVKVIANDSQS